MITKYITLLLFVFGFLLPSKGQNPEPIKLCSGEKAEIEVTKIFEGSVFEWSVLTENGYLQLSETSAKLVVSEITDETIVKMFRCVYFLDRNAYDSAFFEVTFHPNPEIEIIAENLCEGQLASFSFISTDEIKNQVWTLNNDFQTFIKNPDYICVSGNPISISLNTTTVYGCSAQIDTLFYVTSDIDAEIIKVPQFSDNKFIDEVDCGNSVSVFQLNNLQPGWEVLKWEILADNETILNVELGDELKINKEANVITTEKNWITENTLKVKWEQTNTSKAVLVKAVYSNGVCQYETNSQSILVDDNSPTQTAVFQKPNSTVLIIPAGITDPALQYMWGYTTPNGNENLVQGDRYLVEFDALVEGNQYWVETWYVQNEFCRVRNFLGEFQPKNISAVFNMSVYPNPVNEWLNISLKSVSEGQILVTDLNGVLKKSFTFYNESNFKIDITDLQPGGYMITFQDVNGKQIETQRVVVQ